jgi:hypothetical protein
VVFFDFHYSVSLCAVYEESGLIINLQLVKSISEKTVLNQVRFNLYLLLAIGLTGCNVLKPRAELPSKRLQVRDQLTIHSDFYLPQHHRLIDGAVALRSEVTQALELPTSDEPIHVYLFENEAKFRAYIGSRLVDFPDRRAFFIKNDTTLMVMAFWGDRVAEDLRHEVTHGYLHSVVPAIPLWLDEGLAEFFEVAPGENGVNASHVRLLAESYRSGRWQPDLTQLEKVHDNADLTQLQYAEAWLWVHFLLKSDAHSNKLVCQSLKQIREVGTSSPLLPQIEAWMPNPNQELLQHLKQLADGS